VLEARLWRFRASRATHQRLVKTTPNPRATKKSSGDELFPWLLLLPFVGPLPAPGPGGPLAVVSAGVEMGVVAVVKLSVGIGDEVDGGTLLGSKVVELLTVSVTTCRTTTRIASATAGLRNAIVYPAGGYQRKATKYPVSMATIHSRSVSIG